MAFVGLALGERGSSHSLCHSICLGVGMGVGVVQVIAALCPGDGSLGAGLDII